MQYALFKNNSRKDKLRKTLYDIKEQFGTDKVIRAAEPQTGPASMDLVGFESIKDLHTRSSGFMTDEA